MRNGILDEALLEAVRGNEPVATTEIDLAVGIARQRAGSHLGILADEGDGASEKVGPARVWGLPADN